MLDFEVQRCTRQCAATGRELQPGELYYAVLLPSGGSVVRQDYAAEAWHEPPQDAIGWWKAHVPSPQAQRVHWAPNQAMLHYFQELENQTDQVDVRYVLSLLLIRRRVFRQEETEWEGDRECLCVFCPATGERFRVVVWEPSRERIRQIQQQLADLLFAGPTDRG